MVEEKLTYTVKEASKILGLSEYLFYNAVRERKIPHLKFGSRIIIPKKALHDLLEKTTADQNPKGELTIPGRLNINDLDKYLKKKLE